MLNLKNLDKSYKLKSGRKYHVLKKINLNLKYGEFIAIIGRSGSGKTSLLNVLGGLDTYDSGKFYIDGMDTSNYIESDWNRYRNQKIGFIFQQFNLIYHLTVYENVEIALISDGLSIGERKKKVLEVIKKVGLEKHTNKKPGFLSGGEQQRVAIARAIVNNPDIILADELTGQLDKKTAIQILDLIKEVSQGKLVIIVTHMEQLMNDYVTRIIKISDGTIKEDTTLIEVENNTIEEKENKKIRSRDIIRLGIKNVRKKWISSLSLMLICSFILSLVMTSIILAKNDVQNDMYHVLAAKVPMNLIEISKSDDGNFDANEIEKINNFTNVQSVIPVYNDPIYYKDGQTNIEYEILPEKQNEFYLKNALVCGNYPSSDNEIILDIYTAIKLVDVNLTLYSRYQLNMISDEDIWEKVKGNTVELTNRSGETFKYSIAGIVNKSVWDYSTVDIYLSKQAAKEILGESNPIKKFNIYIDNIDEQSRNDTINKIRSISNDYYFETNINNEVNDIYNGLGYLIQFVKIITGVLTVISTISVFALINYTVHTRTKEVGILKSLGVNRENIKFLFTFEYLYITFISIILSYPLSMFFINLFIRFSNNFYAGYGIKIPPNIVWTDITSFLHISLSGIVVVFLSSLIPIQTTVKLPVVEIVRSK